MRALFAPASAHRLRLRQVRLFRISNRKGSYAELLDYGARIVSIVVPDREGRMENVVLRYNTPQEYLCDRYYLGATIGPVANRIAGAHCRAGGREFFLEANEGENCNHSGQAGFHAQLFEGRVENNRVIFSLGYHGRQMFGTSMCVEVIYELTDDDRLTIEYRVQAQGAVLCNMTNHTYFNLSGGRALGNTALCRIEASQRLEQTELYLPTGRILPTTGVQDFRQWRQVGGRPYNEYYLSDNPAGSIAYLRDPTSGRELCVSSNHPGQIFYNGSYLSSPFRPFEGVCIEPQSFPDAPNHPGFPSILLPAGKTSTHRIEYQFSAY